MKFIVIALIACLLFSLGSCCVNECNDVTDWIDEAPIQLAEFKLIKKEILSNEEFRTAFSIQGILFLRQMDTLHYNSYEMPLLREWFRNGGEYISFGKFDTSLCYKECECISYNAWAHIYYNEKKDNYNVSVEIVDIMNLGEGYFAHVVQCRGCNE